MTGGGLRILPVLGIGEVRPGDDVGALIAAAAPWLADGDVVVVTSKIIAKAEGRLAEVPASGPEREAARVKLLAAETARVVARRGQTEIVATHHGFVMASAGIDASNVDHNQLVLLPLDPDAAARALRAGLRARLAVDVAVIVSDTTGRPWRLGLVDVALGAAGLEVLRDYRGERDAHGNELQITQMAVADELASAAELVKNKYDQVPVAVVRGFPRVSTQDGPGAVSLLRPAEEDLFSLGTAEATALGLRTAALLPHAPAFGSARMPAGALERAAAAVAGVTAPGTLFVPVLPSAVRVPAGTTAVLACCVEGEPTAQALAALGADVQRLRAALAAEGLASAWLPGGEVTAGGHPAVCVLAIGPPLEALPTAHPTDRAST